MTAAGMQWTPHPDVNALLGRLLDEVRAALGDQLTGVYLHGSLATGDVAPVVLLPGDPGRAERVAGRLEGAVCYTRNRGLLGFTGTFRGARVSVQTTAMGAPSTAIVAEELVQLGARTLIRTGTAGAIGRDVAPGNVIIATASTPLDGTTSGYLEGRPYAPAASFEVVRALADHAARSGVAHRVGPVLTDDVFYHVDADHLKPWAAFGALAVEMEASALFTVAARHRVRAGCVLTVSNFVGSADWLAPADLQRAIDTMIDVALAAAVDLSTAEPGRE
jgi:purine-nucleoside phosphorylase